MEKEIPRVEQSQESLSLTPKIVHRHFFEKKENYLICKICGKRRLALTDLDEQGIIRMGVRGDGSNYSVRDNRKRYFFPAEWELFIKLVDGKSRFYFLTLLHTGARAMEALNLKAENFDLERGTVTFEVVKHRAAKKDIYAVGKKRTFFVSESYIKEARKFIKGMNAKQYLFLNNDELPANYDSLSNKERMIFYMKKEVGYSQMFKRKMKKTGIKDWKNFALHNIRKTYGNWMRIFEIKTEEICYRLGHDFNTYLAHYGSPMIFTSDEKREIMRIFGGVK